LRPVAARARRNAACTTSDPEEAKRIRSAQGTIAQTRRAASASMSVWPA
jgi:hypothetical protein